MKPNIRLPHEVAVRKRSHQKASVECIGSAWNGSAFLKGVLDPNYWLHHKHLRQPSNSSCKAQQLVNADSRVLRELQDMGRPSASSLGKRDQPMAVCSSAETDDIAGVQLIRGKLEVKLNAMNRQCRL